MIMIDDCWEEGDRLTIDARAKKAILAASEEDLYQTIKFFTRCCKHCQLRDLSCSADMMCDCHVDQVEKIKRHIPRWRKESK